MQEKTLERRMELLRLEGNGLLPPEIVKELSQKYTVSQRAVYYDFETKHVWQPILQEMKRALLTIINRHDQLYRKASLNYMQAGSTRDKILALGLMRAVNKDMFDILQSTGRIDEPKEKLKDADLESILKAYEGAIQNAHNRNLRAASVEERQDPTNADTG